jgi:hypothetical protein
MKLKLSAAIVCLSILSACGSNSNDGVPTVSDYCNVVVDGKPMTNQEFMDKYCVSKMASETVTCVEVIDAERKKVLYHKCP